MKYAIEDRQIFFYNCFEGNYLVDKGNGTFGIANGRPYDKNMVHKAVHLIRDPFDNVVSRFHHEIGKWKRLNRTKFVTKFPRSKEGFRSFCTKIRNHFSAEERSSKYFYAFFKEFKHHVPCYFDFFRYIQWHNLAFATTWDLGIPTLTLHYENYTTNFMETKNQLLRFLDQEDNNPPPDFFPGKTYRDYFTGDEILAVSKMFSKLALEITRSHTMHYFD